MVLLEIKEFYYFRNVWRLLFLQIKLRKFTDSVYSLTLHLQEHVSTDNKLRLIRVMG